MKTIPSGPYSLSEIKAKHSEKADKVIEVLRECGCTLKEAEDTLILVIERLTNDTKV